MNEMQLATKIANEALRVQKANAKFQSLSPAKKRVAIAEDVLAALKLKTLIADSDIYIDVAYEGRRDPAHYENGCHACALGAIFACSIPKTGQEYTSYSVDMRNRLSGIFSEEQLYLIECAFEQDDRFGDEVIPLGKRKAAACKYTGSARNLMTLIMKNIIRNNGTFVV